MASKVRFFETFAKAKKMGLDVAPILCKKLGV